MWKAIKVSGGDIYEWDEASTYIHHPPYFQSLTLDVPSVGNIQGRACWDSSATRSQLIIYRLLATSRLILLPENPARAQCPPKDFNQYGARRGNDLVMARGTFCQHPPKEPARRSKGRQLDKAFS